MALLSTEIERIYTEIVLGLPRSESLVEMRPEVVAFWDTLSAEVERMRADGKSFKMISEFPNTIPVSDELRYNPQQPRKPNGQWGSTGGIGATGDGGDAPSGGESGEGKYNTVGTNESKVEIDPDIEEMAGTKEYAMVAEGVLNEQQGDHINLLDSGTLEALEDYTGNGHTNINKSLRGAPPPPPPAADRPRLERQAELIDDAIRGAPPLEDGVIVYRGIGAAADDTFQTAPVGATFIDQGIVSTSLDYDSANKFAGQSTNTVLKVRVPAGGKAMTVGAVTSSPGEFEVLLPTSTTFTVVGKERQPDGRIVVVVDAATGK